jgi:hypothetical protein
MSKQAKRKTASVRSKAIAARAATPKKRSEPVTIPRTMILFGLDENKRPRAARFLVGEHLGLLAKAADAQDLIICEVNNEKLIELAKKLPAGKVHAPDTAFVPYVRKELYDKIVEVAGSEAIAPTEPPKAPTFPRSFEEIASGHLVIAQESLEWGWWEAIVFEVEEDVLTLRYRDYPRLPRFKRSRNSVALLSPAAAS